MSVRAPNPERRIFVKREPFLLQWWMNFFLISNFILPKKIWLNQIKLHCYVFRLVFWCLQHLKAGAKFFFWPFSTFFNHRKMFKPNKKVENCKKSILTSFRLQVTPWNLVKIHNREVFSPGLDSQKLPKQDEKELLFRYGWSWRQLWLDLWLGRLHELS